MDDIKRFIAQVKREADKDEDFVLDRVRLLPLYKKLSEEYENIDELVAEAAKRGGVYEQARKYMLDMERERRGLKVLANEADADRLIWIVKMFRPGIYKRFTWRHGKESMDELALETLGKTRNEYGIYIGR